MIEKEIQAQVNNFLHNLTWLRKEFGLSKRSMAAILGVSIRTLNKIEQGQLPGRSSVSIIFRAQDHFHISAKDLFRIRLGG